METKMTRNFLITAPGGKPFPRIALIAATILLIGIAAFWFFRISPADANVLTARELEDQYGLQVRLIGVTAGGGMVDFRLKVVDKDKAALLLSDAEHVPQLHVVGSDVVLSVPGESIETMTLEDDGIIFILFPNPGGAVKPGTKVSVVFGELRLTDLKAQ